MSDWKNIINTSLSETVIISPWRENNGWLGDHDEGNYKCGSHYNHQQTEIMGDWVNIMTASINKTVVITIQRENNRWLTSCNEGDMSVAFIIITSD